MMQSDQNQYDFILNPDSGQPQKKSLLPQKLGKKQLMLLGGGVLIILMLLIIVLSMVLGGGPDNKQQLLGVVARQNELIRVSDIALKDARGTDARNLAMTTKLSLLSDQASLTAALKAQKVKIGGRELKAAEDPKTDQLLTTAAQNNRFDEAYLDFIQGELVEYQKSLAEAYQTTTSKNLKETMRTQTQNASLIIGVDPDI